MSSREAPSRGRHAAVGVGLKHYVWGGESDRNAPFQTTTLESFDVCSETWEQPQQLRGALPDGLHSMAVTIVGETAYSFGGQTISGSRCNTIYEIHLPSLQCREIAPRSPSNAPKQKAYCGVVHYNQKLVVHGGGAYPLPTDELHVFDLETSK